MDCHEPLFFNPSETDTVCHWCQRAIHSITEKQLDWHRQETDKYWQRFNLKESPRDLEIPEENRRDIELWSTLAKMLGKPIALILTGTHDFTLHRRRLVLKALREYAQANVNHHVLAAFPGDILAGRHWSMMRSGTIRIDAETTHPTDSMQSGVMPDWVCSDIGEPNDTIKLAWSADIPLADNDERYDPQDEFQGNLEPIDGEQPMRLRKLLNLYRAFYKSSLYKRAGTALQLNPEMFPETNLAYGALLAWHCEVLARYPMPNKPGIWSCIMSMADWQMVWVNSDIARCGTVPF